MKKLLKDKRFKAFSFILLVFFILILLVFHFTGYYRYVLDVLYPTQKAFYETYKTTKNFFQVLVDIKTILDENEKLKGEIQRLKFIENNYKTLKFENFKLKKLLNFSKNYRNYKILLSQVIGYPPDFFVKAVFIDLGKKDGINVGDLVVSDGFLAGKVVKVGNFSSKVLLTNDKNFKILARTRKTREVVFYSGKGELDFVKPNQDIRVGDIIETASIDGYPKGIPIGEIVSVEYKEGSFFKKVRVKPFVKQFVLEYLLVISKRSLKSKKQ